MFLSDLDIQKNIESGDILITDFDNSRLQPASYDIRLGNKFLIVDDYKSPIIDPVKKILPEYREIELRDDESRNNDSWDESRKIWFRKIFDSTFWEILVGAPWAYRS